MKTKSKGGFTLIEVVVSIVLISMLSMGFLQALTGFVGITKKTIDYDEATNEFAEIIDKDNIYFPNDGEREFNLGKYNSKDYKINIKQYIIEDSETKSSFIFYKHTTD